MHSGNVNITEFQLVGFKNLHNFRIFIFIFFLLIYIFTLSGNLLIVFLVATSARLHSPMYFFLSNLSVSEIVFTTNIIPNMLDNLLSEDTSISFPGCLTQYYFFSSSATTECLLLAIMSYDRYLATCRPLHYFSLMNFKLCCQTAMCSWLAGLAISMVTLILLCKSHFCGPNIIDSFFCDLSPLIELSCSDKFLIEIESFVFASLLTLFPFLFIITTYIIIIYNIFKIPSSTGRKKTFSTCSSHLVVVSIYYGTLIAMYVAPSRRQIFSISKALSLLYTVVTPLFNPIVYSLRNKEIHIALNTMIKRFTMQPFAK
ncbi:olfactory receptor 11L1-like [Hyla sarda]|uniref:olfactory receptor 11L1-like n=1 Tax=Hyla sarda TaxID=327740 RepID=UPI0024C34509|nr:olfactory receptor 11L1-like [Hyla sarda]